MGMYTSIIVGGKEYQIKCGYDDGDRYGIGDTVDWKIWPDQPGEGKLLDGVYDGCCYPDEDKWVIIKDHKVFRTFPKVNAGIPVSCDDLEIAYSIVEYDREWWTDRAWIREDIKSARSDIKYLKWKLEDNKKTLRFLRSIARLPEEQIKSRRKEFNQKRMSKILAKPIIKMLNYKGFVRKIFKVKKLKSEK